MKEIIRHGTSAWRQRAVFREEQSLQTVVYALVKEFETDKPILTNGNLDDTHSWVGTESSFSY